MRRPKRYCPAGIPAHIIQRGNNRAECFRSGEDMAVYIGCLREGAQKFDVEIHGWVLMPNHVHLLVTPGKDRSSSLMMQHIGRFYVRFFNRKYSRSGTLWEGRFRSCLVQAENYFLVCQRYIELNPVRAGLVRRPDDYHWSSYHTNALGIGSSIVNPHEVYLALGSNEEKRLAAYRDLFLESIPKDQLDEIRYSVQKNLALGSKSFKDDIEDRCGQRLHLLKRGPRRSPAVNF